MEGLFNFVSIIVIVFGVLQIILFFKLWGMTNDIRDIKNKYLNIKTDETTSPHNDVLKQESESLVNTKFQINDMVRYKPENIALVVIGYSEPDIFKCKALKDNQIYYFKESYLEKMEPEYK